MFLKRPDIFSQAFIHVVMGVVKEPHDVCPSSEGLRFDVFVEIFFEMGAALRTGQTSSKQIYETLPFLLFLLGQNVRGPVSK